MSDYGRCVSAGACAPRLSPGRHPVRARPDFPVTHVRWEDVGALLVAGLGGRLPTEAGGEYAARGADWARAPFLGRCLQPSPRQSRRGGGRPERRDGRFRRARPRGILPRRGATPLGLLERGRQRRGVGRGRLPVGLEDKSSCRLRGRARSGPEAEDRRRRLRHVLRGGSFEDALGMASLGQLATRPGRRQVFHARERRQDALRGGRLPGGLGHERSRTSRTCDHARSRAACPCGAFSTSGSPGGANLRLKRGSIHRASYVRAIAREADATQGLDHVVIMGDLTNLALESESALAREVIEQELGMAPLRRDHRPRQPRRVRRAARAVIATLPARARAVSRERPARAGGRYRGGAIPGREASGSVAIVGLLERRSTPAVRGRWGDRGATAPGKPWSASSIIQRWPGARSSSPCITRR